MVVPASIGDNWMRMPCCIRKMPLNWWQWWNFQTNKKHKVKRSGVHHSTNQLYSFCGSTRIVLRTPKTNGKKKPNWKVSEFGAFISFCRFFFPFSGAQLWFSIPFKTLGKVNWNHLRPLMKLCRRRGKKGGRCLKEKILGDYELER